MGLWGCEFVDLWISVLGLRGLVCAFACLWLFVFVFVCVHFRVIVCDCMFVVDWCVC